MGCSVGNLIAHQNLVDVEPHARGREHAHDEQEHRLGRFSKVARLAISSTVSTIRLMLTTVRQEPWMRQRLTVSAAIGLGGPVLLVSDVPPPPGRGDSDGVAPGSASAAGQNLYDTPFEHIR